MRGIFPFMGQNPCGLGRDITANVNFRMASPSRQHLAETTLLGRLPASIRDEAIWQYHVTRSRGLVFWAADQSFSYLSVADCEALRRRIEAILGAIPELLDAYDPRTEAVIVSEYPDSLEFLSIDELGELRVLRKEYLPCSISETDS